MNNMTKPTTRSERAARTIGKIGLGLTTDALNGKVDQYATFLAAHRLIDTLHEFEGGDLAYFRAVLTDAVEKLPTAEEG